MAEKEKQFRVRLTELEIRYLIHALGGYDYLLRERLKKLETKERWLRSEFIRTTDHHVLIALEATRKQLAKMRPLKVHSQGVVCRDFLRRLNGLLNGRKLHSRCDYWLRTLKMNPE